jgi:hypothetical protein
MVQTLRRCARDQKIKAVDLAGLAEIAKIVGGWQRM